MLVTDADDDSDDAVEDVGFGEVLGLIDCAVVGVIDGVIVIVGAAD